MISGPSLFAVIEQFPHNVGVRDAICDEFVFPTHAPNARAGILPMMWPLILITFRHGDCRSLERV